VPPTLTITTSSTISGELEMPQNGTSRDVSVDVLCDQIFLPVVASSAFNMPVAPIE
jgi:hypothetical protein